MTGAEFFGPWSPENIFFGSPTRERGTLPKRLPSESFGSAPGSRVLKLHGLRLAEGLCPNLGCEQCNFKTRASGYRASLQITFLYPFGEWSPERNLRREGRYNRLSASAKRATD